MSFHLLLFSHFFSSRDSTQVHCVDLGESFQTHIYLKNLASIQPRTSSPKFGRSPRLRSRLHNPPLAPRSSTGSTTVSYSSTATSTRSRSPPCGRTALNSKRCRFLQYLAKNWRRFRARISDVSKTLLTVLRNLLLFAQIVTYCLCRNCERN